MGRDISIEVFRVLLMFGVCLCHTIFVGAKNHVFGLQEWLYGLASGAVDGFVFISGWYGIRLKWRRVLSLYAIAFFCALEMRILMVLWQGGLWNDILLFYKDVAHGYWFLHAYVALMLFAPLLNSCFSSISAVKLCFIPLFVFVFVWGWLASRFLLFDVPCISVYGQTGHSWVTLIGVYATAKVCRFFEIDKKIPRWVFVVCVMVLSSLAGFHYSILGGYNSVIVLAMVISLFCLFKNMSITSFTVGAICNWVAPSLFAIYLIHPSPLGRDLIKRVGMVRSDIGMPDVLLSLIFGFMVFFVSFLIDQPRLFIVRFLKGCFYRITLRIKSNDVLSVQN